MSKRTLIAIHVIFWIVNLTITFLLFQVKFLDPNYPMFFWKYTTITWAITIGLFYIHYLILIPRFVLNKKFIHYAIFLILLMLAGGILLGLNWNHYQWEGFPAPKRLVSPIFFAVFSHTFAGGALKMLDYFISSERVKRSLLQELRKSELLYLKSQMSPHFLFNTLNNIYSLALNKSSNTSEALRELKLLMSYIQDFKNGEKISIREEIDHLKSFIALNDLRYGCEVVFDYDIKQDREIEPLLLLPFIENAYKHGRTDNESKIEITLLCDESIFKFEVDNKLAFDKRKDDVGGIGIKNIKRRLEIIYGDRHQLFSTVSGDNYSVSLTITGNEK